MPLVVPPEPRLTRPAGSLREEAILGVWRTASALQDSLDVLLREHGISSAQYDVLRVLRGAGLGGLCRNDIRERLFARMPDVTRLLDRLEAMDFVRRERGSVDRRVVTAYLTPSGERLLSQIDAPIAALYERQLRPLKDHQVRTLIDLLTLARKIE